MHVKKGDKVIVITGKEKGKSGTILSVIKGDSNRVIVEGLNLVKRHTKPKKAGEKGGIVSIPQSIHISNVKLADKKEKKEAKPKKEVKAKKEKKEAK